ncbi:MAG: carbohydrate ABC transporter permease [Lachnospiraceae bacterium]|nr:carbohydrate ABC transporter permease [Lachnospiraceae bacterium]
MKSKKRASLVYKFFVYILLIFLAILCIFPFWVMIINGTRSTAEISQSAVALLPSGSLLDNFKVFERYETFAPVRGFFNSMIISVGATICAVYFSTLTAYGVVAYKWKFRNAFFTFILAVMMIPGQVTLIGYTTFVYKIGMQNNFLMLILPAIQAPSMVFFMRQYMIPSLSLEIVESARIDGAKEFYIFNRIALPIMKPAMATQAIFTFVSTWNDLFRPMVLLPDQKKNTLPMMVSLLKGDAYKTEYGTVYLGLTLTVLPLFIVYFLLSKYIIAGVALGSVKG